MSGEGTKLVLLSIDCVAGKVEMSNLVLCVPIWQYIFQSPMDNQRNSKTFIQVEVKSFQIMLSEKSVVSLYHGTNNSALEYICRLELVEYGIKLNKSDFFCILLLPVTLA